MDIVFRFSDMLWLQGKYSSKSDAWSFAVTLWEILTFAREQPFEEMADEKVIENVTHFYQDNGKQVGQRNHSDFCLELFGHIVLLLI